jgi:hypothetical protein
VANAGEAKGERQRTQKQLDGSECTNDRENDGSGKGRTEGSEE